MPLPLALCDDPGAECGFPDGTRGLDLFLTLPVAGAPGVPPLPMLSAVASTVVCRRARICVDGVALGVGEPPPASAVPGVSTPPAWTDLSNRWNCASMAAIFLASLDSVAGTLPVVDDSRDAVSGPPPPAAAPAAPDAGTSLVDDREELRERTSGVTIPFCNPSVPFDGATQ